MYALVHDKFKDGLADAKTAFRHGLARRLVLVTLAVAAVSLIAHYFWHHWPGSSENLTDSMKDGAAGGRLGSRNAMVAYITGLAAIFAILLLSRHGRQSLKDIAPNNLQSHPSSGTEDGGEHTQAPDHLRTGESISGNLEFRWTFPYKATLNALQWTILTDEQISSAGSRDHLQKAITNNVLCLHEASRSTEAMEGVLAGQVVLKMGGTRHIVTASFTIDLYRHIPKDCIACVVDGQQRIKVLSSLYCHDAKVLVAVPLRKLFAKEAGNLPDVYRELNQLARITANTDRLYEPWERSFTHIDHGVVQQQWLPLYADDFAERMDNLNYIRSALFHNACILLAFLLAHVEASDWSQPSSSPSPRIWTGTDTEWQPTSARSCLAVNEWLAIASGAQSVPPALYLTYDHQTRQLVNELEDGRDYCWVAIESLLQASYHQYVDVYWSIWEHVKVLGRAIVSKYGNNSVIRESCLAGHQ